MKRPQGKNVYVMVGGDTHTKKLEGRQCGWSSTLRGKEARGQVGEEAAEARNLQGP